MDNKKSKDMSEEVKEEVNTPVGEVIAETLKEKRADLKKKGEFAHEGLVAGKITGDLKKGTVEIETTPVEEHPGNNQEVTEKEVDDYLKRVGLNDVSESIRKKARIYLKQNKKWSKK